MSLIQNSRALITGGASGIGRLMALRLAAKGAHVILWDIHETNLLNVEREIRSAGGRVSTYVCNLADRDAIQRTAGLVRKDAGGVDILINNAGVVSGKNFLECTDAQIDLTVRVNILAVMWTTKAFLPDMIANNRGHVVTISSAGGLLGVSRLADYSASKFAVFGFDESLRMELRRLRSKVRTTIVCPFYIRTGMFDGVKTRVPWLLPILKPEYAARRIVDAIERDKPRLIMPRLVYTVGPLRILPVRVFDAIASILGVNHSMDDFREREK